MSGKKGTVRKQIFQTTEIFYNIGPFFSTSLVGWGMLRSPSDSGKINSDNRDLQRQQSVDQFLGQLRVIAEVGLGAIWFPADIAAAEGHKHAGRDLFCGNIVTSDIPICHLPYIKDDALPLGEYQRELLSPQIKMGSQVAAESETVVLLCLLHQFGRNGKREINQHGYGPPAAEESMETGQPRNMQGQNPLRPVG